MQLVVISYISERLNERSLVSSMSNVWILPWITALVALGSNASNWLRYALLTGLLSYPYCHAVLVAWNSRNSNSVRTRAVSAALYNMSGMPLIPTSKLITASLTLSQCRQATSLARTYIVRATGLITSEATRYYWLSAASTSFFSRQSSTTT